MLDATLELNKWVADHVSDPDAIVERLLAAEREALHWYVLAQTMTPETLAGVEQTVETLVSGGFRRPPR